jgi:hypothetical protein
MNSLDEHSLANIFSFSNPIELYHLASCCTKYLQLARNVTTRRDKAEIYAYLNYINNNIYNADEVCEFGYLELAKLLYAQKQIDFVERGIDVVRFVRVCMLGFLDFAKWIYDNNKSKMDERYFRNRIVLCRVASVGNISIIAWIYSINLYYFDSTIFEPACRFGHLHTAKWLYEKHAEQIQNFNIDHKRDIFTKTCRNDHNIDTAKWLQTIWHFQTSDIKNYYIFEIDFITERNPKTREWLEQTFGIDYVNPITTS